MHVKQENRSEYRYNNKKTHQQYEMIVYFGDHYMCRFHSKGYFPRPINSGTAGPYTFFVPLRA